MVLLMSPKIWGGTSLVEEFMGIPHSLLLRKALPPPGGPWEMEELLRMESRSLVVSKCWPRG